MSRRAILVLGVLLVTGSGCGGTDSGGADTANDASGDVGGDTRGGPDVRSDDAVDAEPVAWGPEFDWSVLREPGPGYGPWVRWWWPGADVEKEELLREVQVLASNGFGGAEIQAFSAALDPTASAEELAARGEYGSERFYARLMEVMDRAGELGVGIDVTAGSGWPMGGAHVAPEQSLKTLLTSVALVSGTGKVTVDLSGPDKGPYYEVSAMAAGFGEPLSRYMPEFAKLEEVVVGRVVAGSFASNVFRVDDAVELDPQSIKVVTNEVKNGRYTMDIAWGEWAVVGFWSMPDGGFVSLSSQGQDAYIADHFDAKRVVESLDELLGEKTGLPAHAGKAWRAFFNDSFEFKTERHFAADFLKEFEERRGYDLRPWLPVVMTPGADNHLFDGGGIAARTPFELCAGEEKIRYDYQLTVSDLFIERFVKGCAEWAKEHGVKSRVQPYGLRIDVIRAAGEADIAEAEQLYAGGSDLFVKMISSGSHLYNGLLVTAEALVWAGRDYLTTPVKIKAAVDKLYAAGVNSVIFHGFPYRKLEGYGQQGWSAFSSPWSGLGTYSSNISEGNPFWFFMKDFNKYISRVQYLLQAGRSVSDVLVYYPFLGFPASLARLEDWDEPLFLGKFGTWEAEAGKNPLFAIIDSVFGEMDPGESGRWLIKYRPALESLSNAGYTWDWVNDHALEGASVDGGLLHVGSGKYKAVVVMGTGSMGARASKALLTAAKGGVPVFVLDETPVVSHGHTGTGGGDSVVSDCWVELQGLVISGQSPVELGGTMENSGKVPQFVRGAGLGALRLVHREDETGQQRWTFVSNRTDSTVESVLSWDNHCEVAYLYDPWRGVTMPLPGGSTSTTPITLAGYGSAFLFCLSKGDVDGMKWAESGEVGLLHKREPVLELGNWSLSVEGDDVAEGMFEAEEFLLRDWREVPELQWSSSQGVYLTEFELEAGALGERHVLSFPWVHGAAAVEVNGQGVGTLMVPPFEVEVSDRLVAGKNEVRVVLVPALRNRLLALGDAGLPEYVQFKGKAETSMPVGLIGPAYLMRVLKK